MQFADITRMIRTLPAGQDVAAAVRRMVIQATAGAKPTIALAQAMDDLDREMIALVREARGLRQCQSYRRNACETGNRATAMPVRPMHLVQVFLPLETGEGSRVPREDIEGGIAGMADRFGGATAYTRTPAEGLWKSDGETVRDRIVVVEVMVDHLDRSWWAEYRRWLETAFDQEEILIRASEIEGL